MSISRLKVITTTLVAAAAAVMLVTPIGAANGGGAAFKTEGAWVAKVVEISTMQWSYTLSPDPSGRRAFINGSLDVGISLPPPLGPVDSTSPLIGEIVMTGAATGIYNAQWYGLRKTPYIPGTPSAEVIFIGIASGEFRFVEQGKIEGTHTLKLYLPSQDADGDGIPDAGQTAAFVLPVTTIDTRLPSPR